MRKKSGLVTWCFEPSQPQRITSGLRKIQGRSGKEYNAALLSLWGNSVGSDRNTAKQQTSQEYDDALDQQMKKTAHSKRACLD